MPWRYASIDSKYRVHCHEPGHSCHTVQLEKGGTDFFLVPKKDLKEVFDDELVQLTEKLNSVIRNVKNRSGKHLGVRAPAGLVLAWFDDEPVTETTNVKKLDDDNISEILGL